MPSKPERVNGWRKVISLPVMRFPERFPGGWQQPDSVSTARPRPGAMIAQITQTQCANAPAGVRA